MTMQWEPLDGAQRTPERIGGKAAALDRLVAAGMPVPKAAVLTADAYRHVVRHAALEEFLATLPKSVDPDSLEVDAKLIDDAFRDAALPDDLAAAIQDAHRFVAEFGRVSVRSSATAEDRAGASFAGQYRSFLDVESSDVETAVRQCWASLWSPAARAYRRAEGIDEDGLAMAVIIQRMIESEHSGVVFTADPTESMTDRVRIEVVEGLGERLVSGEVTPDVFHVGRVDRRVIESRAPAFIGTLADLALEIEELLDSPQDVEWAIAEDHIYILQARPITTLTGWVDDTFDTAPADGVLFTPEGVAEMLPDVLPPLLWTMNAPMVEEAFRAMFSTLGAPIGDQQVLGRFRGRAVLNLTALKTVARKMPGGSGQEVERQYLGRVVTDERDAPRHSNSHVRRVRTGFKAMRLRREASTDSDAFLEALDLVLSLDPEHAELSTETLVAYRRRMRDVARHGVRTELAVSSSATANYRSLELSLARLVGEAEASLAAQRLTAGAIGTDAGALALLRSLWDAHCDVCELDELALAIYEGPLEETDTRLRAVGPAGERFLNDVNGQLRRAGSRALYGGETWAESRTEVWAALRRTRGLAPDRGMPANRTTEAVTNAEQYLAELNDRLRRNRRLKRVLTGQLIDVRRRLLGRAVADTNAFLRMRESTKAAVLRLGGEERRVVSELALRLVRSGQLEQVDDAELLTDEELDHLALGKPGPSKRELASRRIALQAANAAGPLPDVFEGQPQADCAKAVEHSEANGVLLTGWATSPGRVTGRARTIHALSDAHDLAHGEILVARSSDPSWTPLFLVASGIVMEQGGPLSHAAIIARELGIPAVLNISDATSRISTGTLITIDGTRGTVEIVDGNRSDETS